MRLLQWYRKEIVRAWMEAVSGKRAKGQRGRNGAERHLGVKGAGQVTSEMWCTWETNPFSHQHLYMRQHSE